MKTMRAKMKITSITWVESGETVKFSAVCGDKPFVASGESDDNTYARFTPSGELTLFINNPNLLGKFKPGQKFYLDFTESAE